MFLQICEKLNFPRECMIALESACRAIAETSRTSNAFSLACESLLHPDGNVFRPAAEELAQITDIPLYTVHLVLQVHCLEPLRQIYREKNFSEDFFWELAGGIRHQLLECREQHGIWGNETGLWPWVFHEWQCVTFGRLVYEPLPHWGNTYQGVQQGDPTVLIHIPGGSPLKMDAVMDSLQQAYGHFRHQFPGNIVPFVTDTWLLYPPYMESVFPNDGNVQKFAALFHILDSYADPTYENFLSVFGCPFHGADLSQMPQKTRLQRNLLDYLRRGNPMGAAHGIFFYGENGIIK